MSFKINCLSKCNVPTALNTGEILPLGGLKSAATKLTEPTALKLKTLTNLILKIYELYHSVL